MTSEAIDHQAEFTHLMMVGNISDPTYDNKPKYFKSVKEASDAGDEIIKKYPDAQCDIYQIRTRLRGKVEIMRQDYNSSKTE